MRLGELVMRIGRLVRHVTAPHWRTRLKFPASSLDAIEQAIARAERTHAGEIRFAVETSLPPQHVVSDMSARTRALEVFGSLRVWDTEHNNGVLIYVQLADRVVEIVADRGLARIGAAEWEAVCRLMERHFKAGHYEVGSIAGVDAVGTLLARHFPRSAGAADAATPQNQLPDRPSLL
jgi:uncharacterized membrane protein